MPCVLRWPGVIKPGTVINEVTSMEDWLPTFLAAAGVTDVKEKLLKGYQAGTKTFKVHMDESEFLVRSGHSCLGHPLVVEEVRRILLKHLTCLSE